MSRAQDAFDEAGEFIAEAPAKLLKIALLPPIARGRILVDGRLRRD